MPVRVAVIGALGRMGSVTCRALSDAADLELVAAVARSHVGEPLGPLIGTDHELAVSGDLDALAESGADVAVDFTVPSAVGDNLLGLLERRVHAVVGATGLHDDTLERARQLAEAGPARALIAPNFALGAVMLMRFAEQAARHLPDVEIVELHHDRKVDAPSGTALRTAEMIASARTAAAVDHGHAVDAARGVDHHGVRIHSVRLPGLVAHQEVVFGAAGQTLTLRHDTTDRSAFMPGVLLACRRVGELDGLTVGLEHLL